MACATQAQNFTFNQINCPELPEDGALGNVHLSSTGEAIFTGNKIDAYYNGSSILLLENTYDIYGGSFSAIEESGKIFALSFRKDNYLYEWNDSSKTWFFKGINMPTRGRGGIVYMISSSVALFLAYANFGDTICLWKYNIIDTTFVLLKSFPRGNQEYLGINGLFVRENDVIFSISRSYVEHSFDRSETIILSYSNDSIKQIDVLPFRTDRSYLFDNNFIYFSAGESREKIIKWNSTTLEEEVIYNHPDLWISDVIVLSSNEIIFYDGKIKMLTVNTGKVETLLDRTYASVSYNEHLKKALFVSGDFITEMTIADGIISFSDNNPIKLYPNPATDQITIESNSTTNKIEIYNNLGQKVYACFSTDLISEINVSEYPTGIYFVKLSDQNGKMTTTKFIKN
jgi:hypothetical protein